MLTVLRTLGHKLIPFSRRKVLAGNIKWQINKMKKEGGMNWNRILRFKASSGAKAAPDRIIELCWGR